MTSRAFSIDGRTFAFDAPLGDALPIGAYVRIAVEGDRELLGQVLDEEIGAASERVSGHGNLLADLDAGSGHLDGSAVFGSGTLEPAADDLVAAHLASSLGGSTGIELGEVQRMPGVPAQLHAKGFGRHTFLCGQSGSGKTYTLGIVLERLLLDTDITIVVGDPNSDYVNLQTLRPAAETGLGADDYRALAERYEAVASRIHVFGLDASPNRLAVRFGRLTFEQQTMVLGIDPIADPEIYNAFVRTVNAIGDAEYSIDDIIAASRSSFADDERRLGLRIENLGVDELSIWARGHQPIAQVLPQDARMAVMDLGSVPSQRESSIAAAAMLGRLWENRHAR
ncbi:MAG: ATP-binding protein, partial [Acidimicrobiia bacterium]|nr:ATP-binding protein [Acidimicrobiia bacterium]